MHPLFPELDQLVDDHVTKPQVAQCRVIYFFSSFLSSEKAHPLTGSTLTKFSRWDSKAKWLAYFSVPLTRGRFAGSQRHLAGHSDRFRVLPWCLPWMLEGGIKIPPPFCSFSPESTKQLSGTSLRLFAMHADIVCVYVGEKDIYFFVCATCLSQGTVCLAGGSRGFRQGEHGGGGHFVFIVFVVFVSRFDFFPASFYFYLLSSLNLEIIITGMHFVYSKIECRQAVAGCPWAMSSTVGSLFHWHIQGLGLSMSRLLKTDRIKGLVWCNYFSKDRIMLNGKYFWEERMNTSLCLGFVLHAYKQHNSQKKVNNQGSVLSMDTLRRTYPMGELHGTTVLVRHLCDVRSLISVHAIFILSRERKMGLWYILGNSIVYCNL